MFLAPAMPAFSQKIAINAKQIDALQIRLEKVQVAAAEAVALLPATVIPPLNSRFGVSAPFAGTVLNVEVVVGQHIKAGTPLATIASREMLEAVARLKQSEVELRAAEVIASRHRSLAERRVGSVMKAEETQTEVAKLRVANEQYSRIASLGNIKVNNDGSYTLSAPRAGHVVETRATAGGSLEAMAAAVVIDTSDELWLQAQLPASLIEHIGVGDKITVGNGVSGNVISVGSSLDPVTRSTILLARLPPDSGLVLGQMVTLTVSHPAVKGAMDVSSRSVTHINGKPVVFTRSQEGFTVTPVSIRGSTADIITITGDLETGQEVAVTGIAQLEKMQAGE
jgi:cobalt-zinc-cadmium efflux system membrane fusion protein